MQISITIPDKNLHSKFTETHKLLVDSGYASRLWQKDHTLWADTPDEISNRLGWLDAPEKMKGAIARMNQFASNIVSYGITQVILLGMGGSSLAPEMFSKTFGSSDGYPSLSILDSTDPGAIHRLQSGLDPQKTLFIVATKSGGTVETLSFLKYFYTWMLEGVGKENAGEHFVAITDPGSRLEKLAAQYNFREIFINDPDIGGRYSVLSFFGMVPAALLGMDLDQLLESAKEQIDISKSPNDISIMLGATLGVLAREGIDKLTLILSPEIESFGDWVEQLIAESTGKSGTGILPIVGEKLFDPSHYRNDRLFVRIGITVDRLPEDSIPEAGFPLIDITLKDKYELGGQFALWELATAVASHILNIHPFNQPNVESAKLLAQQMMDSYIQSGTLPSGKFETLSPERISKFLGAAAPGDYVAIQAFINPTIEARKALQALRDAIFQKYQIATTLGIGPRFLHSTGQLHKGDRGNGLFIQFLSDAAPDIPIPDSPGESDSSYSFGVLKQAQALGDAQALLDNRRRLISFRVSLDSAEEILVIAKGI